MTLGGDAHDHDHEHEGGIGVGEAGPEGTHEGRDRAGQGQASEDNDSVLP